MPIYLYIELSSGRLTNKRIAFHKYIDFMLMSGKSINIYYTYSSELCNKYVTIVILQYQ